MTMLISQLQIEAAELAVVQAAMAWRDALLANPGQPAGALPHPVATALAELGAATYRLATTCPQCNEGGHVCPGDGDAIGHGATDCGRHDEPPVVSLKPALAEANEPDLQWYPRTWADVRTGDTVRMPGSEQTAVVAYLHVTGPWHVDPHTGTSARNPPQPLEHGAYIGITFDTGGSYHMDPTKPVEILADQRDVTAIELLAIDYFADRVYGSEPS